jgi:hypothetical protein
MATASLGAMPITLKSAPSARKWFDMRDLAQVADHIHDRSEIEVLEGPGPPPREGSVH